MKKKFLIVFLLLLMSTFFVVSPLLAGGTKYDVIQITSTDSPPHVNDLGQVVWVAGSGLYLYDGANTIQIADNLYSESTPLINNSGHVIWAGEQNGGFSSLFLYDGANTIKLADNVYYYQLYYPTYKINDSGQVAWQEWDGTDYEIFLYDGTGTIQLTNNSYTDGTNGADINEKGQLVWMTYISSYEFPQVFFYDGSQTIQLPITDYLSGARLSDNGQVVWVGSDGAGGEIFLYDGVTTTKLTNNSYYDRLPEINASGQVAWQVATWNGPSSKIYFYNGSSTIELTKRMKTYQTEFHRLNDKGQVVWQGYNGTDNDIYLYNGSETIQLTGREYDNARTPQINNKGEVVYTSNKGIFLVRPVR